MAVTLKQWLGVCSVVTLWSAVPAWADDGAVTGVGGRISIMDEHPAVALVSEHVHARVSLIDRISEVECVFVLSNHGAADTVLIGFPESASGDTNARPFLSFQSYVDGQAVTCTRQVGERRADPLFWWTKKVYFAGGQTRIIRDEYRSPLGVSIGDSTGSFAFFEYSLWSGSSWSGDIGAASIVLTLSPCGAIPEPQFFGSVPVERDACEYRWHLSEVEPGHGSPGNVHVAWLVPFAENQRRARQQ